MIEKVKPSKNINNKDSNDAKDFTTVFITTFTTVFLAELGDKTQIATMLLTAQSGMPIVVFVGAALALICSSFVGVILGRWLAKSMPTQRFQYISGLLMIGIGVLLGAQAINSLIHNLQ